MLLPTESKFSSLVLHTPQLRHNHLSTSSPSHPVSLRICIPQTFTSLQAEGLPFGKYSKILANAG